MDAHITQQHVYEAADTLYASNQNPTIKAVREFLGHGSNTTIHKYLSQWKEAKAEELAETEEDDTETKLKDVTQQLKQQQRSNQQLGKELLDLERKLAITEQELKTLTLAFSNQTLAYNEVTLKLNAAVELSQEIKAERDSSLKQLSQLQQQLITQFQNDIKQINQESLAKVSEISIKNQDAWLVEKVKNKVLETTITELKAQVANLDKILQQEKNLNQPLRKKIVEQEVIITKHIDWAAITKEGTE